MAVRGAGIGLSALASRARRGFRTTLCVVLLAQGLTSSWALAAAVAEHRVALVIGNASYKPARLKNPRNDAGLMARTLAAAGFEVMTVMDGTVDEMRAAVADFGKRLQRPDTVALFYYAGHGVQVDGDNYLIPLGATFASTDEVTKYAVALQSVFKTMERASARLNIVLLDACRDNPFGGDEWATTVSGLAPVVAPAGTIIGYATAPGQAAQDGSGVNSPYTSALASEIPKAGASLEEVFRATRRHVLELTANAQTPWEHSSLVSEFSFVPSPAGHSTGDKPHATVKDAELAEIDAWDAIKTTRDSALLKAHLQQYPEGLFAELAAVRIAKLEAMRTQTPWSMMMTGGVDPDVRAAAAAAVFAKAMKLDSTATSPAGLTAATKLFAEAAAEGHPAAQYRLGRAYDKGRGIPKDLLTAARWYERAAEQNEPPAMSALGTMHEFGEGAAPNLVEALRLYRKAADAGDAPGLTSLGYLYSQGKGVARDDIEARRLYRAAVDKAYPRAMYNLALMDLNGEGGKVNVASAVKLLQDAAALNHAPSLLQLSRHYDQGYGIDRSPARAATLLLKASKVAAQDGRPIDVTASRWSFRTRREIQKQLAVNGLYNGGFHGFFNKATRKALVAAAGP